MNEMNVDSINRFYEMIDEIHRQQMEQQEKALAEIIQNFDFIVGSIECKDRLMGILPEGANIICSSYITDPTMIYAIKKFDIQDYINKDISFGEGL